MALVMVMGSGHLHASPPLVVKPKSSVSQPILLKDWAVARCLTKGFGLKTPTGEDAANSAAALLERGQYGMEAYEAIERLVDRQLAKTYGGSTGGTYTTLKCLDLLHDAELDRLVRTLKPTPAK